MVFWLILIDTFVQLIIYIMKLKSILTLALSIGFQVLLEQKLTNNLKSERVMLHNVWSFSLAGLLLPHILSSRTV